MSASEGSLAGDAAASPFRALDRRRAFEQIIFRIEEALLNGAIRPGDRLPPERSLAQNFGVSRPSVREALRVLEVFGVVVARQGTGQGSGSIVTDSAATGLTSALRLHTALLQIPTREIVEVRVILETHAARSAATLATAEQTEELREIVSKMAAAADIESFHKLDTDFHVSLARLSGNVLLPVLMESIRGSMYRDMVSGFAQLKDWEQMREKLNAEHNGIVDCIAARDSDAASEAVKAHIMHFYGRVMEPYAASGRDATEA